MTVYLVMYDSDSTSLPEGVFLTREGAQSHINDVCAPAYGIPTKYFFIEEYEVKE